MIFGKALVMLRVVLVWLLCSEQHDWWRESLISQGRVYVLLWITDKGMVKVCDWWVSL